MCRSRVKLLEKQFTSVPKKHIEALAKQNKTLSKTYLALYNQGKPSTDANDYLTRLHQARDLHPKHLVDVLEHELEAAKKAVADIEGIYSSSLGLSLSLFLLLFFPQLTQC